MATAKKNTEIYDEVRCFLSHCSSLLKVALYSKKREKRENTVEPGISEKNKTRNVLLN